MLALVTTQTPRPLLVVAATALTAGLALAPAAAAQAASIGPGPQYIYAGDVVTVDGDCDGTIADSVRWTLWRLDADDNVVASQIGGGFLDEVGTFTITVDSDTVGTPADGDQLQLTASCYVTIDVSPAEEAHVFDPIDIGYIKVVIIEPDPSTQPVPPINGGVRFRTGIDGMDAAPGAAVTVGVGLLLLGVAAVMVRRRGVRGEE